MVGPAKVNWLKVADGGFRSEEEKPASYVELSLQLREARIGVAGRQLPLAMLSQWRNVINASCIFHV